MRLTWSDKVKQRDGNRCVICGSEEQLQAHHVKPGFLYPECRKDVDNGITLCKDCHQNQHCGHYAGFTVRWINGMNPDPEGRMEAYIKTRNQESEKMNAVRAVWASNKTTGAIICEAAKLAGEKPSVYIAKAISMRLAAEGFDHDRSLFIQE